MPVSKEIGDALEVKASKQLGGERVKQSGGGHFFKLDVHSGGKTVKFLWSCKATSKKTITITAHMLAEARRAARGMLGRGDSYEPGLVFEVEGESEPWAALPLSVMEELLTEPAVAYKPSSKAAARRARLGASKLDQQE